MLRRKPAAFTLVELLVVIAMLAALMALVVPSIQGARESARRMQCQGNVRQLAQACRNYENAAEHLPTPGTMGWPGSAQNGGRLGDPNAAGAAAGGWLYVILPFIDQQPLYDAGFGLTSTALHTQMKIRIGTAVSLYTCPTRGSPLFEPPPYVAGAQAIGFLNASSPVQVFATNPTSAARSDYAGSRGGDGALENMAGLPRQLRSIIDGYSNVFLCGERYLSPDDYNPTAAANFECNNRGWSVCGEGDVYASGKDQSGTALPLLQDTRGVSGCVTCLAYSANAGCWGWPSRFGSPHNGVPMAMVDGSVKVVSFDILPSVFASICESSDSAGTAEDLD